MTVSNQHGQWRDKESRYRGLVVFVDFVDFFSGAPAAAASSVAMSSFVIGIIAAITRSFVARSLPLTASSRLSGTICHETPNLSESQPHWLGAPPPASSLSQ